VRFDLAEPSQCREEARADNRATCTGYANYDSRAHSRSVQRSLT
jgi:hypothetical protein